jgi:hypothetical protein
MFRATHVARIQWATGSQTVALRRVTLGDYPVDVFRDVYANEYFSDPITGISEWPCYDISPIPEGHSVPWAWLVSPKAPKLEQPRLQACAGY